MRWIRGPLLLFRSHFRQNAVILLVAIPAMNVEAADSADLFRICFRIRLRISDRTKG